MRKLVILFLVIGILWYLLTGCVIPPTPSNIYSISVNTFDNSTGQPVTGVSLFILENGQNINLNNDSYQTNLNLGQYSIYLSKSGYITKGYILNLTADTVINAYLNPVSSGEKYGAVSGNILNYGENYSGSFDVCTASRTSVNDTPNITSPFSNIASVCGNIAVSIYTTTINGIDKIVYLKTSLNPGDSKNGLSLTLPAAPLNYSGAKPEGDLLIVKQSDGYILASQITNNTNYSFGAELLPGDALTLESSQTVNDTGYFTRVAAGSAGGTINLQYETIVPDFTVTNSGSNYVIDFNKINFASYYEVYVIQITGTDSQIPFEVIGLSGTSVKVPQNIFTSEADITLIYVRAINLAGFNANSILAGTQSYQNYSYTEKSQSLNLNPSSINALNLKQSLKSVITKTKTKYNLHYLCAE